jgi:hypothetical protein
MPVSPKKDDNLLISFVLLSPLNLEASLLMWGRGRPQGED